MYPLAVLSVALAALAPLASASQQATFTNPLIACGIAGERPCPDDTYCQPDENSDCVGQCPGYCVFRNSYPSCGGHTIGPNPCPNKTDLCVDDPRTPGSCGMACDATGICLDADVKECNHHGHCHSGLWCYPLKKGCTGKKCKRICM